MNIYEYNSNAINVFSTVDNGSIASAVSSTINNGTVTELVAGPDYVVLSGDFIVPLNSDFTIDSESLVTYGYVFDTQTVYPYGSIKFNSIENTARSVVFIAATEPIKLSSIERNRTIKVWVGSGTLFEIGGGQELTAFSWLASSGPLRVSGSAGSKAIYSYNSSSIEGIPNSTNYGSISGAHTASENYGSVADISGGNSFDYGYIINQTSLHPFGTFSALGAAKVSSAKATYIGSGSLFAISGTSQALTKKVSERLETIRISGESRTIHINAFAGSGVILNTGSDLEKASYNYNQSSVTTFNATDFGSVTASGVAFNYGNITVGASQFFDYGFVYDTTDEYPHGKLQLSGSASEIFKPAFAQTSTGGFFIRGAASRTKFEPTWKAYIDIAFTGGERNSYTKVFKGSGTLGNIGSKIEKTTYSYNSSSIETYSTADYGFITASGTTVNYGSVANDSYIENNYGYIWVTDTINPFGSLILTGSAVEDYRPTFAQLGSGGFSISGESRSQFKPIWISEGTITISGGERNSSVKAFVGSGNIKNLRGSSDSITYDYNESSIVSVDGLYDYGSVIDVIYGTEYTIVSGDLIIPLGSDITLDGNDAISYGFINSDSYISYDYGYVYDGVYPIYPYGTLKFGGNSQEKFNRIFVTDGKTPIFAIGGASESRLIGKPESTVLFRISGDSTNKLCSSYVASGSLSKIGSKVEKATYSYNTSSTNLFSSVDYGVITASGVSVNYGLINNGSSVSYDYDYIITNQSVYPFGTLTLTGSATEDYRPTFAQTSTGGFFIRGAASRTKFEPTWKAYIDISIVGDARYAQVRPYIGSGYLDQIGSKEEKATFSYNSSSIETYGTTDYGLITASGVSVNYGLISNITTQEFDYGDVWITKTTYPYGTLNLSGTSSDNLSRGTYKSSGSLFAFGSAAEVEVDVKTEPTVLFTISGESRSKFSSSYIASGSLSKIGSKTEKATFSYNTSSTNLFSSVDYGFITASGVSVNYGSIETSASQFYDYDGIWNLTNAYPFGTLTLTGSAEEFFKPIFAQVSTGGFFISGDSKYQFKPTWTSVGDIILRGESSVRFSTKYTGTGYLDQIGSKEEKATFSYNSSSIETYGTTDYGVITASGVSLNYDSVLNIATEEFDYGDIWIAGVIYPYGTLNLSGSSSDNLSRGTYKSSGSLFAFGSSAEVEVNLQDESIGLFTISGNSTNAFIRSSVGSGSLNNVGDKVEKATFNYNESSIANYGPDIDLGSITDLVYGSEYIINSGDLIVPLNNDLILDDSNVVSYGYINDSSYQDINYGYVYQTSTIYPYGSINISGSAIEDFEFLFAHTGSGSLFAIGGTAAAIPFKNIISKDAINISGSASINFSAGYIASGSLSKIGSKIERATYSYNTSSIDLYNVADYGFIDQVGNNENYGSVSDVLDTAEVNYGVIWNLAVGYPFGTLKISGAVNYEQTRYIPEITGTGSLFAIGGEGNAYSRIAVTEKQTFVVSGNSAEAKSKTFIGSGSLFTIGGLVESVAANPQERNQLFKISGDAIEKNTESYNGTGSVYLQTGIYPEYLYYRPTPRYVNSIYGEIGGSAFVSGDSANRYFAVYTHVASGSEYLSGDATARFLPIFYGSGRTFISGNAAEKDTNVFVGSGSLFGISGVSESRTSNPPEETQLFRISGAASERQTDAHVAFITSEVRGESRVLKTSAFVGDIEITIDGSKVEKKIVTQVGSGSFSVIKGSAEVYSTNPPEETALFRVSGGAITRYISVYTHVSSGSEFISGASSESRTNKFIGSGTLFEIGGTAQEFTVSPITETALFRISGAATDKFRREFISSGTEFVTGSSTESQSRSFVGIGSIFAVGDSFATRSRSGESSGRLVLSGNVYNVSQQSFNGSGSLFTVNGATQSKVVSDKTTESVLSISGNASIRVAVKNATSGSEYIYGSSIESHTETFTGSGSLFKFSSALVASNFAIVTDTILFRIVGESNNSITYDYNGEFGGFGELIIDGDFEVIGDYTIEDQPINGFTNISGQATVNVVSKYDGSGSEFISGDVIVKDTSSYNGAGSLFGFGGSAESSTSNPPEERADIKISGEATNIQRTKSEFASGSYTYQGNSAERKTNVFVGSGSLFSIISTTSSTSIQIKEQESNELFRIGGESNNSYSKVSQFESGRISISGNSIDDVVLFTPPRVFGTII